MDLGKYRSIQEIVTGADFNDSRGIVRELNNYLQIGWELIAVHERGWRNDTERNSTVYILGHAQVNAPSPDQVPF